MAFQRSYSKVWWGSDNQLPAMFSSTTAAAGATALGSSFTSGGYYSSYFTQQQQQHLSQLQQHTFDSNGNGNGNASGGYHSLDFNHFKPYNGNLSRIQEVDDEHNISKLSWGKRDSPGSLRSQDSGFSDNDESHSTRSLGGRSSKNGSPRGKGEDMFGSPVSARSAATPPTVIRRVGKSEFYSPLVSVSRRISFSGSPAVKAQKTHTTLEAVEHLDSQEEHSIEGATLMAQLDSMQLVNTSADNSTTTTEQQAKLNLHDSDLNNEHATPVVKPRRRRRVLRNITKPLTPMKRRTLNESSFENVLSENEDEPEQLPPPHEEQVPPYNNETVYLGAAPSPTPYNNETVVFGAATLDEDTNNNTSKFEAYICSPFKAAQHHYNTNTSTPKHTSTKRSHKAAILFTTQSFENPLLNGHEPALQMWLKDLRLSYEHEVMSTLQTKSISQEAFKNLTITTNTVAKLIRQLQQRAMYMQSDFERIERILCGEAAATLHEALNSAEQLVDNITEFTKVLERRAVFFSDSRLDRKKFEDNIEQIRIVSKDTRYSLERHHYINLESLLDDVQVLKRYLLITIRLVFEKMVRVIVQSIENGHCDLMLRANINMIATLMNIDYEGFASLTDAFVQSEAVRALLIVCLENRLSSVRALALRALATICCAPAAIAQLGSSGGIEIVRDILQVQQNSHVKRGEIERREAVSLLTQITAAWHGPDHRVDGLKDCVETIIEGLTNLITNTTCTQALLLCAAALNNFSRIDRSSHYSIMSNEAIFKLIETLERKQDEVTIFLYEQIVAMLHNMSLNKKCHSHLANGSIINFITSTYQTEFYKNYHSRAESDAQRRTIKAILHTLTRLVHDSPCLGVELLEQRRIPAFFNMVNQVSNGSKVTAADGDDDHSQLLLPVDCSHSRDISLLARQLLLAQKQEQERLLQRSGSSRNTNANTAAAAASNVAASDNEFNSTLSSLKLNLTRQESYV